MQMVDIPEEPLRDSATTYGWRSHSLVDAPYGFALVPSRQPLYVGIVLRIIFAVGLALLPSSVWRFVDNGPLGPVTKYVIFFVLFVSYRGPILAYKVMRRFAVHAEFDLAGNQVRIIKGKRAEEWSMSELVAVQVCYARTESYASHQLILVFQVAETKVQRRCLMRCRMRGSVWGIAQRLSERLNVPLLDCATKQHRKAEKERL